MGFLTPSTPAPLTLEERASSAAATAASALSLFEVAATDLEQAASVHADVAAEAQAEIDRHLAIRAQAEADADQAVAQARRIRELVGGAA